MVLWTFFELFKVTQICVPGVNGLLLIGNSAFLTFASPSPPHLSSSALTQFFQLFPEYQANDFYATGEVCVASLARLLLIYNTDVDSNE